MHIFDISEIPQITNLNNFSSPFDICAKFILQNCLKFIFVPVGTPDSSNQIFVVSFSTPLTKTFTFV